MTVARENIIVGKSDFFAARITRMYRYLSDKHFGESDMPKQIHST